MANGSPVGSGEEVTPEEQPQVQVPPRPRTETERAAMRRSIEMGASRMFAEVGQRTGHPEIWDLKPHEAQDLGTAWEPILPDIMANPYIIAFFTTLWIVGTRVEAEVKAQKAEIAERREREPPRPIRPVGDQGELRDGEEYV